MLHIDKTTLNDLSIFHTEEGQSVFHSLDLTITSNGKEQLHKNLRNPFDQIDQIKGVQQTLQSIMERLAQWPKRISNGTIKVVESFYETAVDPLPAEVTRLNAFAYKVMHGPDYSLVKYSAIHCFDFIKGMDELSRFFNNDNQPEPLRKWINEVRELLKQEAFQITPHYPSGSAVPIPEALQFARFIRFRFKQQIFRLLHLHAQIDAWYGMARAVKELNLHFPEFLNEDKPYIETRGLRHILLPEPVSYDVTLHPEKNFMFLTGANMAGKSTFIKSVGIAVFLAHTGMGVPAQTMRLSCFNGILTNINVADNIVRGESYFFNEVQRIKNTILQVSDGKRWLILIDELFKGTNVQDAMKCSTLVIEGLIRIPNTLFILSTHLYEIGDGLRKYPNIQFSYFETSVQNDQLTFSYQLREGISNDRFGYLILKKEGVVDLLQNL